MSVLKMPVLLLAALSLSVATAAQSPTVNVTIDAAKTGAPISKYIYGQFLEHGGNIVNEGVWAEMLEDRKFYNTVTSKQPEQPAAPGGWRRPKPRYWVPVGGDEAVTMDSKDPYTGDHSPLVKLNSAEPHGVLQAGLAVRKPP
ncbi:MAG TPA: hypothetical protein VMQ76_06470, partial [Terracidiphilus sp.]|nr:hypothetical protein [Terracidiphilus sp.]